MKKNKNTALIIVLGIIVFIVFIGVIFINLIPNYESDSYYVKVDKEMNAKIESVNITDGKLILTTSGDPIEYCVKSTRTKPNKNSICWNKVKDNTATISVFTNKKYYVWIKDNNGTISNYVTVNSK